MRIALLAVAAFAAAGASPAAGAAPTFTGTVEPVRWADLRFSYRTGCPVGPSQLRTVSVSHWGFDGKPRLGRIVVAKRVASRVLAVFRTLWEARFPIRRLQPAHTSQPVEEREPLRVLGYAANGSADELALAMLAQSELLSELPILGPGKEQDGTAMTAESCCRKNP